MGQCHIYLKCLSLNHIIHIPTYLSLPCKHIYESVLGGGEASLGGAHGYDISWSYIDIYIDMSCASRTAEPKTIVRPRAYSEGGKPA